MLKHGGGTRSRTEVDGFAIHCIATLLFRRKTFVSLLQNR